MRAEFASERGELVPSDHGARYRRCHWVSRAGLVRAIPFLPGTIGIERVHVALIGNVKLLGRCGPDLLPVQQDGVCPSEIALLNVQFPALVTRSPLPPAIRIDPSGEIVGGAPRDYSDRSYKEPSC